MWHQIRLYLGLGSKADYASGDGSPGQPAIPTRAVALGSFLTVLFVMLVFSDASFVVQVLLIVGFMIVGELLYLFVSRLRTSRPK